MNLLEQCDNDENENPPTNFARDELKEKLEKMGYTITMLKQIDVEFREENTFTYEKKKGGLQLKLLNI